MSSDNRVSNSVDASVVVPAKNAASTIAEQLDALARQTFEGSWEVIVVDNGSSDATIETVWTYGDRLPLKVLDASDVAGSSYARNVGARAANGKMLCFCDADDVVADDWLAELVRAGSQYKIAGGRLETTSLNDDVVRSWRPTPNAERAVDRIDFAPSGNMMIHASVFADLGGFDEKFLKSHDVELSRRAKSRGYEIGFWPEAVVSYRLRSSMRQVAHQGFRGGRAAAQSCANGDVAPRSLKRSIMDWLWLVTRVPTTASRKRRGIWMRRVGEAGGRIVGSARWRVRYL